MFSYEQQHSNNFLLLLCLSIRNKNMEKMLDIRNKAVNGSMNEKIMAGISAGAEICHGTWWQQAASHVGEGSTDAAFSLVFWINVFL